MPGKPTNGILLEQAEGDYSEGSQGRPLVVGTTGDYAPFSTLHTDGTLVGLDIELILDLAQRIDRTVELRRVAWRDFDTLLAGAGLDVLASGITVTPERQQRGGFSRPYVRNATVLLARRGERPAEAGARLGVNRGGYLESVARARFPGAVIVPTEENARLAEKLAAREFDLVLSDALEAQSFQAEAAVEVIRELERQEHALYFPPGREALRQALDAALGAALGDGTVRALAARFGIDPALVQPLT